MPFVRKESPIARSLSDQWSDRSIEFDRRDRSRHCAAQALHSPLCVIWSIRSSFSRSNHR